MLRISKLTDYGTIILVELAAADHDNVVSAAELASTTRIGVATVSKLLKLLGRADIVSSTRGAGGGYRLARPPAEISAADIIDALEGPLSITECSSEDSNCDFEDVCNVGGAWQRINAAIRAALDDVSLADLVTSNQRPAGFSFAGVPINIEPAQGKKT